MNPVPLRLRMVLPDPATTYVGTMDWRTMFGGGGGELDDPSAHPPKNTKSAAKGANLAAPLVFVLPTLSLFLQLGLTPKEPL